MYSFDSAGRNVEVAFCFDTTGSMYSCLNTVCNCKLNNERKKEISLIICNNMAATIFKSSIKRNVH